MFDVVLTYRNDEQEKFEGCLSFDIVDKFFTVVLGDGVVIGRTTALIDAFEITPLKTETQEDELEETTGDESAEVPADLKDFLGI